MITVILNAYRRPHTLQIQVNSIRNQTIPPSQIWLWQNYHEDWNNKIKEHNIQFTGGIDRIVSSNYNWKYIGRFSLGMLAETEYVAFFDDDTIPGPRWFENCLNTLDYLRTTSEKEESALLGGVGILFKYKCTNYMDHTRVGWPSYNSDVVGVDLVGHAWFLRKKDLIHMWKEDPVTVETAEDMHLSYCLQKYGNIKTYVPPHPMDNKSLHSSLMGNQLGIDNTTPSVVDQSNFFSLRTHCMNEYINKGWRLKLR